MNQETEAAPKQVTFSCIAAGVAYGEEDWKWAIGNNGEIPWRCQPDIIYFNKMTVTTESEVRANVVVMGRKTWESIPDKFRPLDDRLNCIISQKIFDGEPGYENYKLPPTVKVFRSFVSFLAWLDSDSVAQQWLEKVWVIGGSQLYSEAIQNPRCEAIYLTDILPAQRLENADTFFPDFNFTDWRLVSSDPPTEEAPQVDKAGNQYRFMVYKRN